MNLLFFVFGFLIFPLETLSEHSDCEGACCKALQGTVSRSRVPKGFLRKTPEGRKKWAESILGRNLSVAEAEALELANWEWISYRKRNQHDILYQAGFSKEDIKRLIRNRVVRFDLEDNNGLFENNLRWGDISGENSWFMMDSQFAGRIIRKIDRKTYQVKVLNYKTGKIIRGKMSIQETYRGWLEGKLAGIEGRYLSLSSATPDLNQVFEAFTSNRKRITMAALNLPPRKEQDIPGYSSAYTRGLSEVLEFIEIGKKLRELRVNPLKTHIDYFAIQIEKHIAHIREGILDQTDLETQRYHLARLKRLETKALKAKKEKRVTYKWWLDFNIDLSVMISPANTEVNPYYIDNAYIYQFPLSIVFPTITGELGVMALNRAFPLGIYPVGLLNRWTNRTIFYSPYEFLEHDLVHTQGGKRRDQSYISEAYRQFHYRLLQMMENLPLEKRKNVEIAYFILIHEYTALERLIGNPSKLMRNIVYSSLKIKDERDFKGLIDDWNDEEKLAQQFKTIAEDFQKVFSQIKNE